MSLKRRIERKKQSTGEWDVRYGGRTVEVRMFINTDDELEVIKERLLKLARGPRLDMALIGIGEFEGDKSELWKKVHDMADETIKKEVAEEN